MNRLPRSRSGALFVALCLLGAGLAAASQPAALAGPASHPARTSSTAAPAGQVIPGEYIVVMKPRADASATAAVRRSALRNGGDVLFDYSHALKGFSARLPEQAVAALANNPNVLYIELIDETVEVVVTQPTRRGVWTGSTSPAAAPRPGLPLRPARPG